MEITEYTRVKDLISQAKKLNLTILLDRNQQISERITAWKKLKAIKNSDKNFMELICELYR
jgi:hypothetical protein